MAYSYNYPAFGNYNPITPFAPRPEAQGYLPQPQMAQMPASPQVQQTQQPNMVCRPVASEEEARAVPTDFGGAMLILTDTGHGRIYTKSLNYLDGSAIFNTYQLVQPQQAIQPTSSVPVEYVSKQEVEKMRADFEEKLEEIKKLLPEKASARKAAVKGEVSV